jgi:hypothetical protein
MRWIVAATIVLGACGGGGERAGPSTAGGMSPSSPSARPRDAGAGTEEWLAVFESAEDPDDLDEIKRRILRTARPNVAIGPAACWREVPEALDVGGDHYVAGVVAATEQDLDAAVAAVGEEPIFRARVTLIACAD